MAKQQTRKQISVRVPTWRKAQQLRSELAETSGREVTMTDVLDRALQCLSDAHAGQAWLSAPEAAVVFEERHRQGIASALVQFAARVAPEKVVRAIRFLPSEQRMEVDLGDAVPVPVFVGALRSPAETV